MWEKRKDPETTSKSTSVPASSAEPARERFQPSAIFSRATEPDPPRCASIGKAMTVKGKILSREDLFIDGEVEGTLEVQGHHLTIGPNGKAHASVKAREVVVMGTIYGNVEAIDKISIRKDGRLVGDVKTAGIVIEDGAYFKGSIDIVLKAPIVERNVERTPQPVSVNLAEKPSQLAAVSEAQK